MKKESWAGKLSPETVARIHSGRLRETYKMVDKAAVREAELLVLVENVVKGNHELGQLLYEYFKNGRYALRSDLAGDLAHLMIASTVARKVSLTKEYHSLNEMARTTRKKLDKASRTR
jgi:hypothetical protein